MGIDVIFAYSPLETIFEDSLKFIGITLWTAYFFTMVLDLAKGRGQQPADSSLP